MTAKPDVKTDVRNPLTSTGAPNTGARMTIRIDDEDNWKESFCKLIDGLEWSPGQSIFQKMLQPEFRMRVFNELMGNRNSIDGILAVKLGDNLHVNIKLLRAIACAIFGDVKSAWTHYQIHANEQEAVEAFEDSGLLLPSNETPKAKTEPQAELVSDISDDSRLFTSSDLPVPAKLSNMIPAQFLRIVKEYGWSEALPLLYLSRQGCHAILYEENEQSEYPALKSSNMIVKLDEGNSPASLVFNPNFRGNSWESMSSKEHVIKVITDYVSQLDFELAEPIDFEALHNLPDNPTDNGEFEDCLLRALGPKNCVEEIRLTATPPNFKHSYHGVRDFNRLFTSLGRAFSFTVSYEDLCNGLEALNRLFDNPCYLPLSRCQMKPGELATQKYILLSRNVWENMGDIDWRIIGAMAQKLMKGQNIDKMVEKYRSK